MMYSWSAKNLLLCALLTAGTGAYAQNATKQKQIQFGTNSITLAYIPSDTIWIEAPEGNITARNTKDQWRPMSMNGEKIWLNSDLKWHEATAPESLNILLMNLVDRNSKTFEALPDGAYDISVNDIVVDTFGQTVYYNYEGILRPNNKNEAWKDEEIQYKINKIVHDYFSGGTIKFEPAQNNGRKVISGGYQGTVRFRILDHKINFVI